jgi:hypothetical protein
VRAFLDRDDLNAVTAGAYRQTLRRLRLSLGDGAPLASLTGDRVAQAFATAWTGASAATWNRHLSAVRSFGVWAAREDLAAVVSRRAQVAGATRQIDPVRVDALLDRPDVPLRERTLWRLLHESAAPVTARPPRAGSSRGPADRALPRGQRGPPARATSAGRAAVRSPRTSGRERGARRDRWRRPRC